MVADTCLSFRKYNIYSSHLSAQFTYIPSKFADYLLYVLLYVCMWILAMAFNDFYNRL